MISVVQNSPAKWSTGNIENGGLCSKEHCSDLGQTCSSHNTDSLNTHKHSCQTSYLWETFFFKESGLT